MKNRAVSPDVLLFRHGRTTNNELNIIDGQEAGGQLTDFGREQVYHRARELKARGIRIAGIFSSDLERALDTSAIVAQAYGGKGDMLIHADARLREIHMGKREGQKRPWEFVSLFAAKAMRGINWPLAAGGESHVEVQERLESFLEDELAPRLEMLHSNPDEEGTFLIVSHDLPIQIMSQILNNNEPPITPGVDKVPNADVVPFDTRNDYPYITPLVWEATKARKRLYSQPAAA